jgi:vancomycin resistance protein VanJ
VSKDRAVIVGGDFNAPAGDAIFRLLRPFLKDSFGEAGTGWGNTALNSIPISRPDQIWISHPGAVFGARAQQTAHSDHRMVIADLIPR